MAARKAFLAGEKVRPGKAAFYLISHMNYARIAAGLQDPRLAERHLQQALLLNGKIAEKGLKNRFLRLPAYKRADNEDTYYRVSDLTGWRDLSRGPFWANNKGIVVRGVNLVFLNFKPDTDFIGRELLTVQAQLEAGDLIGAQDKLAQIVAETVAVQNKAALPLEQARDNISLAHYYLGMKNYAAVRFALGQAEEALMVAESDKKLRSYQAKVMDMHAKIVELNRHVEARDPTLVSMAGQQMENWWRELKKRRD
jgi:hypothetical protein